MRGFPNPPFTSTNRMSADIRRDFKSPSYLREVVTWCKRNHPAVPSHSPGQISKRVLLQVLSTPPRSAPLKLHLTLQLRPSKEPEFGKLPAAWRIRRDPKEGCPRESNLLCTESELRSFAEFCDSLIACNLDAIAAKARRCVGDETILTQKRTRVIL
jgi:hypothetical protein